MYIPGSSSSIAGRITVILPEVVTIIQLFFWILLLLNHLPCFLHVLSHSVDYSGEHAREGKGYGVHTVSLTNHITPVT